VWWAKKIFCFTFFFLPGPFQGGHFFGEIIYLERPCLKPIPPCSAAISIVMGPWGHCRLQCSAWGHSHHRAATVGAEAGVRQRQKHGFTGAEGGSKGLLSGCVCDCCEGQTLPCVWEHSVAQHNNDNIIAHLGKCCIISIGCTGIADAGSCRVNWSRSW
jgi:hypothetical protein